MIGRVELPVSRIRALALDGEFLGAVEVFYNALEISIAEHRPVCRNRGACCRFGEFEHRLYVTPVEVAYFLGTLHGGRRAAASPASCPYQVGGMCDTRHSRPMGCRIFFCESAGQGWQEDLTESGLRGLRKLHERFDLPYAYVEWLDALAQVNRRG